MFTQTPHLIALELENHNAQISKAIRVQDSQNHSTVLKLRGIIYLGEFHFTAWLLSQDGTIWFYDGIGTGKYCLPDGHIQSADLATFNKCQGKEALMVIYAG